MTFRNEKMLRQTRRSLGYTRLELGFALLLIVFGVLLPVTKFWDLSVLVDGSMDRGVVKAVQQGISAYAANSRDTNSTSSPYPHELDEADVGDATPQNLFFFYVLPKGIAVEGWAKTGQYEYRAPSGAKYLYDPQAGTFEIRGTDLEMPVDDSARIE